MPNTFLRSQTLRRYCLFESYRKMSIQHRPYPGHSRPMTLNPLCSDLPNISGRLGAYDCDNSKFSGPFQYVGKEGGVSSVWHSVPYANFDASRSSSKYGSSSTVQPESIRLIPCIKS